LQLIILIFRNSHLDSLIRQLFIDCTTIDQSTFPLVPSEWLKKRADSVFVVSNLDKIGFQLHILGMIHYCLSLVKS